MQEDKYCEICRMRQIPGWAAHAVTCRKFTGYRDVPERIVNLHNKGFKPLPRQYLPGKTLI